LTETLPSCEGGVLTLALGKNKALGDQVTDLLQIVVENPPAELHALWLNDCGITEANCDRLAAFLEFFPNLEELHFSDNPINTEMARNMLEVLIANRDPSCNALWLRMERCGLSDVEKVIEDLSPALSADYARKSDPWPEEARIRAPTLTKQAMNRSAAEGWESPPDTNGKAKGKGKGTQPRAVDQQRNRGAEDGRGKGGGELLYRGMEPARSHQKTARESDRERSPRLGRAPERFTDTRGQGQRQRATNANGPWQPGHDVAQQCSIEFDNAGAAWGFAVQVAMLSQRRDHFPRLVNVNHRQIVTIGIGKPGSAPDRRDYDLMSDIDRIAQSMRLTEA
jgi:pterin-4a-carbinolamine dehydratase